MNVKTKISEEQTPLALKQWFLTGGRQEISRGARALTCSSTWKVFERERVYSKCYASANLTPLDVI